MPTTKKRISIVLSWELEDALNHLSGYLGIAVSTLARGLLEETVPYLQTLIGCLAAGDDSALVRYRDMVEDLQKRAGELPLDL